MGKTKDEIVQILSNHKEEIDRLQVKSLALFGSVARGDHHPDSDIDFLVEFSEPTGMIGFLRVRNYLSGILNANVDLVTSDALKPKYKDRVLKECVRAA